jgi:drug/metabolite transporter (DMT)-like permease
MEVVLALVAALLFSLGTVLQAQVASQSSEEDAAKAGFLLQLARKPRWVAGIAADGLGFAAQAAALAIGRLVVVQPLLATAVVFSLPLNAKLGGRKPSRRDLMAAVAVTVGLGVFLWASDPEGGVQDASTRAWIISFALCGVICAALALAARGRPAPRRAALLGIAAGILFALSAALTKATVDQLSDGLFSVFTDWHLYALVVVGYVSMMLSMAALQTGALAPAVATQMSLDPIGSVLLGTLAFDETIHEDAVAVVFALLAFGVMLAGLVYLALHEEKGKPAPVAAVG